MKYNPREVKSVTKETKDQRFFLFSLMPEKESVALALANNDEAWHRELRLIILGS